MEARRVASIAGMATALLVGSLVAAPDASAYIAGDGKGSSASDCFIGLEGYESHDLSPFGTRGKPAIQCTDGNACDLDGMVDGSCRFSIAVAVNRTGVGGCTPTPLVKVKARARTAGTSINFLEAFEPPLDGARP